MATKQKMITPKDFVDMPLSEATRQVIYDIRGMVEKGVKIHMNIWVETRANKVCAVCAGGAAVISFNSTIKLNNERYPGEDKVNCSSEEWSRILRTFNRVRQSYYGWAHDTWYENNPNISRKLQTDLVKLENSHQELSGEMTQASLEILYTQMEAFASTLEKHGK